MWIVQVIAYVLAAVLFGTPIATAIHEFGHFIACRRLGIPVKAVRVGGWPRWRWYICGVPWYLGFPTNLVGRGGVTEPEWPSDRTLWVKMFASGPRMSAWAALVCFVAMFAGVVYVLPLFLVAAPLFLANTLQWLGNYGYGGNREPSDGLGILLAQADPTFKSPSVGAPPLVDESSAVYQAAMHSVGHGRWAFGFYGLAVFLLGFAVIALYLVLAHIR